MKIRSPHFKDRTGEVHINYQGLLMEIIECIDSKNNTVKFSDGFISRNKEYRSIEKGSVKNPYHPSVCGIGYFGVGKYKAKDIYGKSTKVYQTWRSMIRRCYDEMELKNSPTYKECAVDKRWHNFQNFGTWFEENYNPETMKNWCLDKDILNKGNKIYAPEYCLLFPYEINLIIVSNIARRGDLPLGVTRSKNKYRATINVNKKSIKLGSYFTPEEAFYAYKVAKEKHIKNTAIEWRILIGEKAYKYLCKYKVEITD